MKTTLEILIVILEFDCMKKNVKLREKKNHD